MPQLPHTSRRVLEPIDRISEVLFGLIMVLTFTGSLSVAEAGRDDVRAMLVGALGCNLAWGVIDGVLYLMGCLAERGRAVSMLQAVREATDQSLARQLITGALPPVIAAALEPDEVAALHRRLVEMPAPADASSSSSSSSSTPRLSQDDWLGALGVFLLVFCSTFPVAIPFLILDHAQPALRASNAIAVVMLFAAGFAYGRITRRHPWGFGIGMVLLGVALVAMTMALGG
jgi:hypothetical protein